MKQQYTVEDIQSMRINCYTLAARWFTRLYEDGNMHHSYYEVSQLAEEYLRNYIAAGITSEQLHKYIEKLEKIDGHTD